MPIQRRRVYAEAEVDQIVRASEARLSRRGGQTGHTGRLHVLITNVDLTARGNEFYDDPDTESPIACAFTGTPEAVRAVTEALNSPEGQAALQWLDDHYPTGIRVRIEAQVTPVGVRYSTGNDVLRKAAVPSVLVLVERIEEEAYHGIHIHTAFPILSFRRGRPAWLDHRSAWH